ncbi:DAK2 domain-containing protein [Mycoplasmopsis columbinasalis]|uniref:Kinase n=1 Tax=Mycoplasmopsis columbinasalis TaxID=114880 RepID=A0A449BA79_9BACT|nr:DAK2 domain-containing protein [Mycoplasmopsis columbinasalis]VEU78066.1 kinase [Mycoplasmopsis columbinasalis]
MNKQVDGNIFSKLVAAGAINLINNKSKIDALNVFPVPDGDTGTNMSSTVQAAVDFIEKNNSTHLGEVAAGISKAMLFGARGNSGVILSQIFKGFEIGFNNADLVNISGLLFAFQEATKKAYSSVLKPVEGTILTVIKETTQALEQVVNENTTLEEFFDYVVTFARKACDETPNKLKVLREVGVTDSGGEGLYTIFVGMQKFLKGEDVKFKDSAEDIDKFVSDDEIYDGEFGYCTEFILELASPATFEKEKFELALKKKATSLVVVQDNEFVKVHGHTLKPGNLLNFAQKYGEFAKIKSENMTNQAIESRNKKVILQNTNSNTEEIFECGSVSCNLGSGIIKRMYDLGVDVVVESGQTQNPSAKEIIDAINAVNAINVFVFPNNSNIFLSAQQAAQAITNKKVFVIPTKSQLQGINAILNFDKNAKAKENEEVLNQAIKLITTAEVTQATRDTKLNGFKIKQNDYIGITNGKIVACEKTFIDSAKKTIDANTTDETEIITIYYGNEATEDDALELKSYIENQYDLEVEIVDGNQPIYHFIIGFE